MNIALWIITGLLAAAFGAGGVSQLLLTKERYRSLASSQHWVDDFDAGHIKAIGTIKLSVRTGSAHGGRRNDQVPS